MILVGYYCLTVSLAFFYFNLLTSVELIFGTLLELDKTQHLVFVCFFVRRISQKALKIIKGNVQLHHL